MSIRERRNRRGGRRQTDHWLRRLTAGGGLTAAVVAAVLTWQAPWQHEAPPAPQAPAWQASVPADTAPAASEVATIAWQQLPPEAHTTYGLIRQGGPFPYDKDGSTFFNRERLLPAQPRGYYREYTVRTPGVSHRGARRIVCGGRQPREPEACYYTADHYNSFALIITP